jgi:putative spermidine/putrescine transport system permease protein
MTSAVSFTMITLALGTNHMLNKRQAARGPDAGKRLV